MKKTEIFSIRTFSTGTHSACLGKKSVAILATALLATSGSLVHAEENEAAIVEPGIVSDVTNQAVTETDVTNAKTNAEEAKEAVNVQETAVAHAEADVANATEEVEKATETHAEAEKIAKEATPDGIAKAEAAVHSTEAEITKTTADLKTAEATEADVTSDVKTQEGIVDAAKQVVSTAQADVDQAQKNVDNAQAVLDGTNATEVVEAADQAKENLEKATIALTTAEENLEAAKVADKQRTDQLEEAAAKVSETKTNLDKAAEQLETASATHQAAEADLASKQASFTVAENNKNGLNVITLSSEYVEALKIYANRSSSVEARKQAEATLTTLSQAAAKVHTYKVNLNDTSTETYDLNQLPEEVLKELSLFASDLMNQIRKQVGTHETVVSSGSIAFADKVTDKDVEMNWNTWEQGHNSEGITAVAKEYNLKGSDKVSNLFEDWISINNMTNTSRTVPNLTLSQLKQKVYEGLVQFLFPTVYLEWEHAGDVAGLKTSLAGATPTKSYVALDVTRIGGHSGIHFLTIDDVMLTEQSKFETNAFENPIDSAKMMAAYQSASEELQVAKTKATETKQALSVAKDNVDQLTTALNVAKQHYATIEATPEKTAAAQADLVTKQAALLDAKLANDQAQKNLDNLSADVETKRQALVAAQADLAVKSETLSLAKKGEQEEVARLNQLIRAKEEASLEVETLKSQLANQESELKNKEEHIAALKQAPQRLLKSKEALKNAQARLAEKSLVLEKEVATLRQLKAEEATATNHYQVVYKAYQALLTAQEEERLAQERLAIASRGLEAIPVVNEKGRLTGYVEALSQTKGEATKASTQEKTLPQTGTQKSGLEILGMVFGLLGLAGIGLKKKESE